MKISKANLGIGCFIATTVPPLLLIAMIIILFAARHCGAS